MYASVNPRSGAGECGALQARLRELGDGFFLMELRVFDCWSKLRKRCDGTS